MLYANLTMDEALSLRPGTDRHTNVVALCGAIDREIEEKQKSLAHMVGAAVWGKLPR